jgi:hypothetical protein
MGDIDSHIRRGHPIVFGVIILCALIELSISAWLTARFASNHNEHSATELDRTHFILFTACWTVFFSLFYMVLFQHSASTGSVLTSVASHAIFLVLTWIGWVAGAAAVTQMIGGGLNCATQDTFVYCNQLNAMMAFAWIVAVLVTFALVFVLVRGISAARRGDGYRGQLVTTA